MVRQSQASFLLTRPLAQSQRFAQGLPGRVVISPLLEPEFLTPQIPERDWQALVFSSETGVEAACRLRDLGTRLPARAFCVGERTTQAAQAAGWHALSAGGDVQALAALILSQTSKGPILILRPEDIAGDLEQKLVSAGLETVSAVVYRQNALSLTPEATLLLQTEAAVVVPLFSPRTARIFAQECRRIALNAPLYIAAMSAAVVAQLDIQVQGVVVATAPNSEAMRQAVSEVTQRAMGS
jgi:uroporphyrinogen-III synthase